MLCSSEALGIEDKEGKGERISRMQQCEYLVQVFTVISLAMGILSRSCRSCLVKAYPS